MREAASFLRSEEFLRKWEVKILVKRRGADGVTSMKGERAGGETRRQMRRGADIQTSRQAPGNTCSMT